MNLSKNVSLREVGAPVAAANNTDQNSDRIDMSGWDGVLFFVAITDSVATGVATLTIEQNTSDSDSGMAALSGAVATDTSATNDDLNNTVLAVDVFRPRERYVQGVITSATQNIAFGNTFALLYRGKKAPVSAHASIAALTVLASPAEA